MTTEEELLKMKEQLANMLMLLMTQAQINEEFRHALKEIREKIK